MKLNGVEAKKYSKENFGSGSYFDHVCDRGGCRNPIATITWKTKDGTKEYCSEECLAADYPDTWQARRMVRRKNEKEKKMRKTKSNLVSDEAVAEPKTKSKVKPKPESKVKPKPESKVKPKPESKVKPKTKSKVKPKTKSKVKPEPEPTKETTPESVQETTPEPVQETTPEPKTKSKVKPKPESKPEKVLGRYRPGTSMASLAAALADGKVHELAELAEAAPECKFPRDSLWFIEKHGRVAKTWVLQRKGTQYRMLRGKRAEAIFAKAKAKADDD